MDIRAIKNGDTKAFNQLVAETHKEVYRLAFRFLSNQTDAEDITQDVFIETWKNISSFREEANIRTWLYRITVNKSLNHLRKHKTSNQTLSLQNNEGLSGILSTPNFTADRPLENKELKQVLQAALQRLPENQRTAFMLHHYEGHSYQQIAEIMETSLSAVESLIFRGKSGLRIILHDFHKDFSTPSQVLR